MNTNNIVMRVLLQNNADWDCFKTQTSQEILKIRNPLLEEHCAYSGPEHLWPELWKSMGKHAKLKEKQKRPDEKLHLESARKLRGIYFIDPEVTEFKKTIKNARKKLDTSVAPAVPCKIMMKSCESGGSDKNKTKLACILEANESTRMRMGNSIPPNHEDHIAGKGENSLQHFNLVHKFIPIPQVLKIPAAKAAVDKEWEKLEKISAWNLTKVRSKKQVIQEARMAGATVHFASMDICHLKNAELEAKHQKYKGRVVLRGDIVKDISGSYAVFTEQGSSASQMTAAKIMDIISRLPGCDGQAADVVSVYVYPGKNGRCSKIIENSQIGMSAHFGFVYHDTCGQKHGPVWKTQSFLLYVTCWPCKDYLKGTCTNSFSKKWHPPECLFYKSESGCRFGERCSFEHRQVDEQPSKGPKRMVTKVQWQC